MSRRIAGTLFTILVLVILISSCKTRRNIPAAPCKLDFKNARTLNALLKKNQFQFRWLQAKFDAEAEVDGQSTSFHVSLRIRKDSVIWMSIFDPVLNAVEAARVMITKDSVKVINKIHKQYFVSNFDTISRMLHAETDYEIIESLIVGNSVTFYEEEEKLHAGVDSCQYFLGTVRKKKAKKIIEGIKQQKEPLQSIWLQNGTFKIVRILFQDMNVARTFNAWYDDFQPVDSLLFPRQVSFQVRSEKSVSLKLDFSKVASNKPLEFPFTIPSSYERVEPKKGK